MYYRLNRLLYEEPDFVPIRLNEVTDNDVLWGQGIYHDEQVPLPLRATLSVNAGNVMPDIDTGKIPIVSARVAEALKNAGVDNLQLFDIEITDSISGIVHTSYKAMNIVGAISCADLEASEYTSARTHRVNFTKLVIDESRVKGLHMFRLAESLRYILISKKVRDVLEAMSLVGVRVSGLEHPDTYVG